MHNSDLFIINSSDNVAVSLAGVQKGHKFALKDISKGEFIIKYGQVIGRAERDIGAGEHVHTHNIVTCLDENKSYEYTGAYEHKTKKTNAAFEGYKRKNGGTGIRNQIWIIPTVGCINDTARSIAAKASAAYREKKNFDGFMVLDHPYGCSQMGEDAEYTTQILINLAKNDNAAGVLFLGLGCENNSISIIKKSFLDAESYNVRFLNAQDCVEETEKAFVLIEELMAGINFERQLCSIGELKIGLKCGGSDGLSGITANPLVGCIADMLAGEATLIMGEIPELFGAEHILMSRCKDEEVFNKLAGTVNRWKDYYRAHGQVIYDNPSPGNKEGGITTLEEKSLGCIEKGGRAVVCDVLQYTERVKGKGLSIISSPGNDLVSSTAMAAAGAVIILFTTGRGTPFGSVVPTVKIASNRDIFERKRQWFDFNDFNPEEVLRDGYFNLTNKLLNVILSVTSGEFTQNEKNTCNSIAIFKDGVTL